MLTEEEFIQLYNLVDAPMQRVHEELVSAKQALFNKIKITRFHTVITTKKFDTDGITVLSESLTIPTYELFPLSKEISPIFSKEDLELFGTVDDNQVNETSKITSVNIEQYPITSKVKVITSPLVSGTKYIRYYVSPVNLMNPVISGLVKRYLTLAVFNNLSKDIYMILSQKGISSWSLNGVSVSVDSNSFNAIKDSNLKEMNTLYNQFSNLIALSSYGRFQQPWAGNPVLGQSQLMGYGARPLSPGGGY